MSQYLQHSAQALNDAITRVRNNYRDTSQVTATAADVAVGKKIVDSLGSVIDGTLDTSTYYNDGLNDGQQMGYTEGHSAGYSEGYTNGETDGYNVGYQDGVNEATPTLQEVNVTPSAQSQTITPNQGYDGLSKVVVSGDSDLVAENIKQGVEIFGVTGTHQGGIAPYCWRKYSGTIDENTIFLLHGDSFTDSSPSGYRVRNTGVTLSTDKVKFGTTSFCFDGNSWMKIELDEIKWADNFTIEFWIYHTSAGKSYPTPFSLSYPANYYRGYYVHHDWWKNTTISAGNKQSSVSNSYTKDKWFHFAYVKSGTTISVYHDGTLVGTLDISSGVSDTSAVNLIIGAMSQYGSPVSDTAILGYMNEIRLSNVARYTANFTPQTEPYNMNFVEFCASNDANAYPDRATHTDGFYYVKI